MSRARQLTPEEQRAVNEAVREATRRQLLSERARTVKMETRLRRAERAGLVEQFWAQVERGGRGSCWVWTGKLNTTWAPSSYPEGIGEFPPLLGILGTDFAHRISLMLHYGRWLSRAWDVEPGATCDRLCCCPHHLRIRPHEGEGARRALTVSAEQFFSCRRAD